MNVREALADATSRLAAVTPTPRLDSELLMAHALGVSREELLLNHLDDRAPPAFASLLARRLAHEPVAYLTGRRGFWTIELEVGPGVLIPRPDSETLIEAAVDHFGPEGPKRILDLGAGPGTLLLAALDQWPQARGFGVDESDMAIRYARSNIRRLGMVSRAEVTCGGWLSGDSRDHDLVLCNPPYIAEGERLPSEVANFEPPEALFGGRDGLDHYRLIAPVLSGKLAPGGIVCFEVGAGQAASVSTLMAAAGFTISSREDLNGITRCLILSLDRS